LSPVRFAIWFQSLSGGSASPAALTIALPPTVAPLGYSIPRALASGGGLDPAKYDPLVNCHVNLESF
jgi:hypothetical protein